MNFPQKWVEMGLFIDDNVLETFSIHLIWV